jgi:hypothetical protein
MTSGQMPFSPADLIDTMVDFFFVREEFPDY